MERRRFIEKLFSVLALGSLLLLVGCGKEKTPARVGNQEKLWQSMTAQQKMEEPIELAYAKDTPAKYRDASMGKADPNFVPKLTGG